jgi:hypothetical protein
MYVNAKMIPVETSQESGERVWDGEKSGGGNSSIICLIHCKKL